MTGNVVEITASESAVITVILACIWGIQFIVLFGWKRRRDYLILVAAILQIIGLCGLLWMMAYAN